MGSRKYELTNISMEFGIKTLYRIRALKDFSDVKRGELGGWVSSENNLSQEGNCWIYDEAIVFDEAKVCDNAKIRHDAEIYGNAKVFGDIEVYGNAEIGGDATVYGNIRVFDYARVFGNAIIYDTNLYGYTRIFDTIYNDSEDYYVCMGPIGSRDDYSTAFLNKDKKIMIATGCFKGTIEEFKEAVKEKHSNNKYARQYNDFIEYVEKRFKNILEEDNNI